MRFLTFKKTSTTLTELLPTQKEKWILFKWLNLFSFSIYMSGDGCFLSSGDNFHLKAEKSDFLESCKFSTLVQMWIRFDQIYKPESGRKHVFPPNEGKVRPKLIAQPCRETTSSPNRVNELVTKSDLKSAQSSIVRFQSVWCFRWKS